MGAGAGRFEFPSALVSKLLPDSQGTPYLYATTAGAGLWRTPLQSDQPAHMVFLPFIGQS